MEQSTEGDKIELAIIRLGCSCRLLVMVMEGIVAALFLFISTLVVESTHFD